MQIILFSVCLAIGGTISARLERSSGGAPISIEEAPFFVSIRKNDVHKCGGALITGRHVLTALFCVVDSSRRRDYENVVVTGTGKKYEEGTLHRIKSIMAVEDNADFWYDLAVLKLRKNSTSLESHLLRPLPIGQPSFYKITNFYAFESAANPKESTLLHKLPLLLYPNYQFSGSYAIAGPIFSKVFRGFHGYGRSWREDTGGPLVDNGHLVGIASPLVTRGVASRLCIWVYKFRSRLRQLVPNVQILE